MFERIRLAARRLPFLSDLLLEGVATRSVDACRMALALATDIRDCCPRCTQGDDPSECWHGRSVAAAREYLRLAEIGAPAVDAYPCEMGPAGIGCHGTGTAGLGWDGQKFTRYVECPRCHGKGYETPADRKRNLFHDDKYLARICMGDFA